MDRFIIIITCVTSFPLLWAMPKRWSSPTGELVSAFR
jgi:hypothetical protein